MTHVALGIMTIFVGIIFICVVSYSLFRNRRGKGLAALGLFSVMMGLWRLTDTRFTPFIMPDKPVFLFYQRITSMASQIRSHFIFNVLTTISSYCKVDAKKADRALILFSCYLRKNINIIETEGLIDFTKELEQVEDYVALEQMRFEDKITFAKNIETTSFQIPPLTIQPIVENAIKHGLLEHGRSGTVCLCTMREKNHIMKM